MTKLQIRPIHRRLLRSISLYLGLIIFVLVALLPFYWIFISAIAPKDELFRIPPNYLPRPTLENFRTLIDQVPFYRYAFNSVIFGVGSSLLSVVLSFLAAYAFARIKVPGSDALLFAFVLSMALPEIATLIPLFRLLKALSLIDTLPGLVLLMGSVLTPFTVWILVSFIRQVPVEIEEAAIIDGASLPRVLWSIIIPVIRPALATMLIINFINAWNNLLYPLVFAVSTRSKTLSVSITEVFQARSPYGRPWELISSLAVSMIIPVVILVLFSQRAIVRGLTRGAVK